MGDTAKPDPSLGQKAEAYASSKSGQQVGDGECFALADRALRHARARSADDYGTILPDADYVWGALVNLADVRPGDVVQFRDYRYDREVETRNADGSIVTTTDFQERRHHTTIVERVDGNGAITVLEQNSPSHSQVVRRQLFFSNSTRTGGTRTTSITVQGTFWFYRPQSR